MTRSADIEVVIPVYNGAAYLADALRSVCAQSLLPRRIVVVDDGSTDESASVARRFMGGAVSVELLQKANGGLSSARNAGIAASRAELIAFLDADDVWLPDKLALQVARFEQSELPALGVVYCDYDDIDAHGHALPDYPSMRLKSAVRGSIKRRLYLGNFVAGSGSAVLVRRSCLLRVGGFDETLPSSEDWELWLRLAAHYTFDYVPEVLVRLRRHGASMQAQKVRQMLRTDLEVLARQQGSTLDRALVLAALVRKLAETPGKLVRELFASEAAGDRALLHKLARGIPLPLLFTVVYQAKLARRLRAEVRGRRVA